MIKIIILHGGLGNQMFGYAFYNWIKGNSRFSFIFVDVNECINDTSHNGYELSYVFGIKYNTFINANSVCKLQKKYQLPSFLINIICEEFLGNYNSIDNTFSLLKVYDGYWQSERFLQNIRMNSTFAFNLDNLNQATSKYLKIINATNSVSIHIRRGDYLNSNFFENVCSMEYYNKAIDYIRSRIENPIFFIFSDDIDWACLNFNDLDQFVISHNKSKDNWQDMFLMSKCKYNIIANSTFSWWGAWLNYNANKIVISPKNWTKAYVTPDIIPSNWIKI